MSAFRPMDVLNEVPKGCVAIAKVDWWGAKDWWLVADLNDCELREREDYLVVLSTGRYVMTRAFDGAAEPRRIVGRVVGMMADVDD